MKPLSFREGERDKTWFRTDRFFVVDQDYYFSTREGKDIGPFPSHDAAERGLNLYIQIMQSEGQAGIYAAKIAMQGLWASTMYH